MSDPYSVIMQHLLSLPWLLSRFEACSGQDRFTTGAVKPRRSGRGYKALSAKRSQVLPLVFNVLPNDGERCPATGGSKVTRRPQHALVVP